MPRNLIETGTLTNSLEVGQLTLEQRILLRCERVLTLPQGVALPISVSRLVCKRNSGCCRCRTIVRRSRNLQLPRRMTPWQQHLRQERQEHPIAVAEKKRGNAGVSKSNRQKFPDHLRCRGTGLLTPTSHPSTTCLSMPSCPQPKSSGSAKRYSEIFRRHPVPCRLIYLPPRIMS